MDSKTNKYNTFNSETVGVGECNVNVSCFRMDTTSQGNSGFISGGEAQDISARSVDQMIDEIAAQILESYKDAFLELAK